MSDLVRLIRLFRPYWPWMALSVLLALVAVLANIGLMSISGWFIAAMGLAGVAGAGFNYFTPAAIIRGLAITRTAGRYAERVVGHEATFRLLASLRSWLFERLEPTMSLGLGGLRSGDVMTRMRADIDRLELVFLRLIAPALVALIATVFVVFLMAAYSPLLAWVQLLLMLTAGLILPVLLARSGRDASVRLTNGGARLNNLTVDTIEGLAELHVHGAAGRQATRINELSDTLIEDETRLAARGAAAQAAMTVLMGLALACALLILTPVISRQQIAPAYLPALALLALASFEALAALPLAALSLSGTLASARRLFALADAAPAVPEPTVAAQLTSSSRLVMESVGLIYPGASQPALQDINFEIAPGRRVAVIGHSGSGKSSLVNLALRFVAPTTGRITLGGVDLATLNGEDVRGRMSVVEQNAHLFAATIAENLRVARADVTETEMEAVCQLAQLHDFIAAQPKGYATYIGTQGLQLSGGQARRLAVARALLHPAPVLILDEPTEGLDPATARALLDAVLEARRDCGVLLITHQPAALERMHEIIVLDQGRVIARGTPDEILVSGGDPLGHGGVS